MNTIVLMSGDPWLSNSSLKIEGIFTTLDDFNVFVKHLYDEGVISEYGFDCLTGEYGEHNRQCEIKSGALCVMKYELNPKTSSLSK